MESRPLRIAVVGCGHGTLDAIYSSVSKSCKVKDWDSVDLVIIGGDFQAVRHHQDLNVTAMPQKYRDLVDFHHYYYGDKTAPYLTLFIGGNHEASNYLFELFYGGWVANNIYYLGAANVVNIQGLKIAGLSGIYKGHDYWRPHFERLPYNDDTMRSIFHQREIDVRKLLAYRTQVDVGLSHDWPNTVAMLGNFRQLFTHKPFFRDEATQGQLGSPAAASIMDRLRPTYWFSAHLHTRYVAHKRYDAPVTDKTNPDNGSNKTVDKKNHSQIAATASTESISSTNPSLQLRRMKPANGVAISGWTSFTENVQGKDREDFEEDERQRIMEQEKRERSGEPEDLPYVFEETFKKVEISNIDGVAERRYASSPTSHVRSIPQYDGCCASAPMPFKRQRLSHDEDDERAPVFRSQQTDGAASPVNTATLNRVTNPDAIDVQMSDSDDGDFLPSATQPTKSVQSNQYDQPYPYKRAQIEADQGINMAHPADVQQRTGLEESLPVPPRDSIFPPEPTTPPSPAPIIKSVPRYLPDFVNPDAEPDTDTDNSTLHPGMERSAPSIKGSIHSGSSMQKNEAVMNNTGVNDEDASARNHRMHVDRGDDESTQQVQVDPTVSEVSDEVRNQLGLLSSKFTSDEEVQVSPALPFPSETITNKLVKFLALSKAEHGQNFLQLLEMADKLIDTNQKESPTFEYDPEWLAVTRVFHPELQLGGNRFDKTPVHRGDTYYRERIIEEEAWVKANIVEKDLLKIPANFTITSTGDHDPSNTGKDPSMPREVTNPQTVTFCKMLGIDNPFNVSEEERDARIAAGPPASFHSSSGRGGGGGGGFRGGRGRRDGSRGGHQGGGSYRSPPSNASNGTTGDSGYGGRGRGGRGRGRGVGYGRGRGRGGYGPDTR